jgi:FlaA1/EpsC-like NDP-sugar epimerase
MPTDDPFGRGPTYVAVMSPKPAVAERTVSMLGITFTPPHRPPTFLRVALATVASVALSLLADAALVAAGTRIFPSTKGYVHFEFHDYARLTVIGVVIACAAWPVVARYTEAPRRLFFWLAIAVTAVLLLPDLYILHQGQPGRAVAVLMTMHLAIGIVTYNMLVRLAPVRRRRRSSPQRGAMTST